MMEKKYIKTIMVLVLVFAAVFSFCVIGRWACSFKAHEATLESINVKIENVLKLTGSSTLASAAVSAIPGDTATPVADKLADFSEYFLLILCVLYAEKYLLTIIGFAAFKILIPAACIACIASIFLDKEKILKTAKKLALFALVLFISIPLSIKISDMIDDTYKNSIQETIEQAEDFSDLTASLPEDDDNASLWAKIWDKFKETASSLSDKAASILKNMVEALAVLIVTSCIIPVLTLIFLVWFFKTLTGKNVAVAIPNHPFRPDKRQKEVTADKPQLPEKTE